MPSTSHLALTDFLSCPGCKHEFDTSSNLPISLDCGHTMCKPCLETLCREGKSCQFDSKDVISRSMLDYVVNTALLAVNNHNVSHSVLEACVNRCFESPDERSAAFESAALLQHFSRYLNRQANVGASSATNGQQASSSNINKEMSSCAYIHSTTGKVILSRPMQKKILSLITCQLGSSDGRERLGRNLRSLGERCITELILQHQHPHQLTGNLWGAVRARGCQFLGPAMQEEVIRLILMALEDKSALSRKVLVLFVVQRLAGKYPQASKTAIGHVVQLLYRASCFIVHKRENESSLMQLKDEYCNYNTLRREHDSQIIQIAHEAGLRIAPDQWSALLYGDPYHKNLMQSIIDKLQTPQSFSQGIGELVIALKRTNDPAKLTRLEYYLQQVNTLTEPCKIDIASAHKALENIKIVIDALVDFVKNRCSDKLNFGQIVHPKYKPLGSSAGRHDSSSLSVSSNHSQRRNAAVNSASASSTDRKTSLCRDLKSKGVCPRGPNCTFAHGEEELERYRGESKAAAAESDNTTLNNGQRDILLDHTRDSKPGILEPKLVVDPQAIPRAIVGPTIPVPSASAQSHPALVRPTALPVPELQPSGYYYLPGSAGLTPSGELYMPVGPATAAATSAQPPHAYYHPPPTPPLHLGAQPPVPNPAAAIQAAAPVLHSPRLHQAAQPPPQGTVLGYGSAPAAPPAQDIYLQHYWSYSPRYYQQPTRPLTAREYYNADTLALERDERLAGIGSGLGSSDKNVLYHVEADYSSSARDTLAALKKRRDEILDKIQSAQKPAVSSLSTAKTEVSRERIEDLARSLAASMAPSTSVTPIHKVKEVEANIVSSILTSAGQQVTTDYSDSDPATASSSHRGSGEVWTDNSSNTAVTTYTEAIEKAITRPNPDWWSGRYDTPSTSSVTLYNSLSSKSSNSSTSYSHGVNTMSVTSSRTEVSMSGKASDRDAITHVSTAPVSASINNHHTQNHTAHSQTTADSAPDSDSVWTSWSGITSAAASDSTWSYGGGAEYTYGTTTSGTKLTLDNPDLIPWSERPYISKFGPISRSKASVVTSKVKQLSVSEDDASSIVSSSESIGEDFSPVQKSAKGSLTMPVTAVTPTVRPFSSPNPSQSGTTSGVASGSVAETIQLKHELRILNDKIDKVETQAACEELNHVERNILRLESNPPLSYHSTVARTSGYTSNHL